MFLALRLRSKLLSQQSLAPSSLLAAFQRPSGLAIARNFSLSAVVRAASGVESKTVFVKSLSWNVDEEWLRQDFEPFGKIVGARIMTDPQGRSKGFGYIDFEDVASAKKAVAEMHEKEIDGRPIFADFAAPRRDAERNRETSPPSATLFVANISRDATEDSLHDVFDRYDGVNTIRIPKDYDTGATKGIAFVEFASVEDAKKAFEGLRYNLEIDGRRLRLDYSQPRKDSARGEFGGDRGGRRGGFDGGDRRGGRGGFGGGDRGERRGGKSYGLGGYGGER